jgi:hypothetical protein
MCLVPRKRPTTADHVRAWLCDVGAPLVLQSPVRAPHVPTVERVIVAALRLARKDPTVALVLPVVIWRQRHRLDLKRLARAAVEHRERRALGFFLELTGWLAMDGHFVATGRALHRRPRAMTFFFGKPRGPFAMAAALTNSPEVARRWGYLMNMPLESFASAFAKHTAADKRDRS